jgi:hypothetical protein
MRLLKEFAVALIIASASGWLAHRLWVGIVVGVAILAVIGAYEKVVERRSPGVSPLKKLADRIESDLRRGEEIRTETRLATPGTAQLFAACERFAEWVRPLDEEIKRDAPSEFQKLSRRAPWSLWGKGPALEIMDARLKAYSEMVDRLRRRGDLP